MNKIQRSEIRSADETARHERASQRPELIVQLLEHLVDCTSKGCPVIHVPGEQSSSGPARDASISERNCENSLGEERMDSRREMYRAVVRECAREKARAKGNSVFRAALGIQLAPDEGVNENSPGVCVRAIWTLALLVPLLSPRYTLERRRMRPAGNYYDKLHARGTLTSFASPGKFHPAYSAIVFHAFH